MCLIQLQLLPSGACSVCSRAELRRYIITRDNTMSQSDRLIWWFVQGTISIHCSTYVFLYVINMSVYLIHPYIFMDSCQCIFFVYYKGITESTAQLKWQKQDCKSSKCCHKVKCVSLQCGQSHYSIIRMKLVMTYIHCFPRAQCSRHLYPPVASHNPTDKRDHACKTMSHWLPFTWWF